MERLAFSGYKSRSLYYTESFQLTCNPICFYTNPLANYSPSFYSTHLPALQTKITAQGVVTDSSDGVPSTRDTRDTLDTPSGDVQTNSNKAGQSRAVAVFYVSIIPISA